MTRPDTVRCSIASWAWVIDANGYRASISDPGHSPSVGCDRAVRIHEHLIRHNVRVEGDFDDLIHAVGGAFPHAFDSLFGGDAIASDNLVRTRSECDLLVAFRADRRNHLCSCVPRNCDGALPHSSGSTLYRYDPPSYRTGYVHCSMSRDSRDAQARALIEGDTVRQVNRLARRNYDVLCGGSEGTVTLGAEAPDTLLHP